MRYFYIIFYTLIFYNCQSIPIVQNNVINLDNTVSGTSKQLNQDSLFVIENYTKKEYRIPMRDGKTLFTSVYSPKNKSTKYPILLIRTPYSCRPYGADNYPKTLGSSMVLAKDLYILVYQDVRGRFMSEGEFVDVRPMKEIYKDSTDIDESTDSWDTIDWLVNNIDNNNNKVGIWGTSYPGFYAAAACINAHPALVAATPQCPVTDWFWDDFHHNGAFFPALFINFAQYFGQARLDTVKNWPEPIFNFSSKDGYRFYMDNIIPLSKVNEKLYHHKIAFWDTIIQHPNYDKFWQDRTLVPHFNNVTPAVMTVGGWFDAEDLYGPLHVYESIESKNINNDNRIVMGPWKHGGYSRGDGSILGNVFFGNDPPPSHFYRDNIEYPFFKYYLKNEGNNILPEAYMFETGNNVWRAFKKWPPADIKTSTLYLHNNSTLNTNKPIKSESFTKFISDPTKPVPYTEEITTGMTKEYMTDDQRFTSKRPDVIYFQTDTLTSKQTLAGKIKVSLYVSTDKSAADWIVKLIDVYPEDFKNFDHNENHIVMAGYQQMVRSEVFRGRYRNSFEYPEPFEPNKISLVEFELQDLLHTFKQGHRIMIQIQSSWFPLVDINPQNYVDNIYKADRKDFVTAIHKVYSSIDAPSSIEYTILK